MTNKLTKNDSMPKKHSKFDLVVASFEAFIKERCVHGDYFQDWRVSKNYQGTANVFYAWRKWAKFMNPESWIVGAFVWRETKRGYDFWELMNREWINWYHQNLKK